MDTKLAAIWGATTGLYSKLSSELGSQELRLINISEPNDLTECALLLIAMEGACGGDPIDLIQTARIDYPSLPIIVLADSASNEKAFDLLRYGANDLLELPVRKHDLWVALRKRQVREGGEAISSQAALLLPPAKLPGFGSMISKSKIMSEVLETAQRIAAYQTTVLITGESGTGKELLARAIHQNSTRANAPFVAINCGAIPESLVESELFGHRKGAFTDASRDRRGLFEEAHLGTIFLDEVAELSPSIQVKLLRALQERQIRRVGAEQPINIDLRLIAATHRNLAQAVTQGHFREDLFYRLDVVSIHLPPLRERRDDIPPLIEHFMRKLRKRLGIKAKTLSPETLECMLNFPWRGNVRELENCVERALVLSESNEITLGDLPEAVRNFKAAKTEHSLVSSLAESTLSIKQATKELEINLISRVLEQTGGNRTRAAKVLEISHRALLYKIKEYGLNQE